MTIAPAFEARVIQGLQAYFKQPAGPSRAGTDWAVALSGPEGERRIIVRAYSDEIRELSQDQEVEFVLGYVGRLLQSGWSPEQYRGEPGELVAGGGDPAAREAARSGPKRLTTLQVIRAGVVGTAAVALPGAAYGIAIFSILWGKEPFFPLLAVALGLVGAMAWTGVRVARFSTRLAIILTTLPFVACALMTLTALSSSNFSGLLLQGMILAAAVSIAWWACRLARR